MNDKIKNAWKNKHRPPSIKTKSALLREVQKCKEDLVYYVFTYCYIQEPIRGRIKLDEYPYLIDLLKAFQENRFNIINKGRQLGISTIIACYISWLLMFHNDKRALVIATKSGVAKNIIKKIKFIVKNLPKWLHPKQLTDNAFSIEFSNGSSVEAMATTVDAARSEGLSLLVMDEAAHIRTADPEEVWTAAQPTLITGGSAIVLSTPNGVGNWFHKTYTDAENKTNLFNPIFLPWSVHPLRDQKWRDDQDRQGSKKAAQENDGDFLSSGDTAIEMTVLTKHYLTNVVREPIRKIGIRKEIHIYNEPQIGCRYIISADNSRGDAGSKSAFVVINRDTLDIDADFLGQIHPTDFGHLLVEMGYMYNTALLVPENNYLGIMVIQAIIDSVYPNLYYTKKRENTLIDLKTIPSDLLYDDEKIAGFITSNKTRTPMLEKLIELVETRALGIFSKRIIDQMLHFKYTGNRLKAEAGYSDDLIMALAIGCWLIDIAYKLDSTKAMYTKYVLDGTSIQSSSYVSNETQIQTSRQVADNYWKMRINMPGGNNEEVLDLYNFLIRK